MTTILISVPLSKVEEAHQSTITQDSAQLEHANGWYKATFIRRFVASLIDGLILVIPTILISFTLSMNDMSVIGQFAGTLLGWIYSVLFIWKKAATPGKRIMKIKVVQTNGENLTLMQSILRETVGKIVSSLVFGLGYLWVLWDKNSQSWHDKIAGSYVVTKVPNNGKQSGCLVALVVAGVAFVPAIAILAAVVVLIINPLELARRSRDAQRLVDATQVQQAINAVVQQANESTDLPDTSPLCSSDYCSGRSDTDSAKTDGTGWVKVNVENQKMISMPVLPKDPVNNSEFHYEYCSNGSDWEVNFIIESEQQNPKMIDDKGDNPNRYELGSDLAVCK